MWGIAESVVRLRLTLDFIHYTDNCRERGKEPMLSLEMLFFLNQSGNKLIKYQDH